MHHLRLSTALVALAAGLAGPAAQAATTVSTATTTPLATSTAGDVTVASGGTITVTGQPAITVDSGNAVTVASGGTLASAPGNNGGGILVNAGTNSALSNAGTISVSEAYTVDPVPGTSAASGPIANTTGRYGILVAGPASGSLANSGAITVKGLNAAGILSSGLYTGTIAHTGSIVVKGDGGLGIGLQGVTGDVQIGGTIAVAGSGAQALVAGGDIGGALTISNSLGQGTTYTTDAGTSQAFSALQLRTGKAVVEVDGSVAKGIQLFAPCTPTTVSSVVSCTSTGTATTTGSITAVANNPALQIGGANPIVIGAGAASIDGNTYSLAVDGTISAAATFTTSDSPTNGFGVVIGGRGGAVSLPGGIGVAGSISASALDSTATALLIQPGSTVGALTVTGSIRASMTQVGSGAAYAVRDLSGTLASVTNHGAISASAGLMNVAVDLSANSTGATYTQSLSAYQQAQQTAEQAAAGYNAATAVVYTSTLGDILTGSGNDLIAIQSGKVTGNAWLGGGTDAVNLSGDANWAGDLHFGTGVAAVALAGSARFAGALYLADQPTTLTIGGTGSFSATGIAGGSQLAVTVNSGTFGAGSATTLAMKSLTVNSGGTLNAWIDGTTGASSLIQAGTATFASGAKVGATINSLANAAGTYHILTAGSLIGTPTFSASTTVLPVLFKGSVAVQGNDLYLTIARKTAADLGLNRTQTQAYDAIYANALNNTALATSLLQVADTPTLQAQFNQQLPDHAGGIFDFVTRGSRLAGRHLSDDASLYSISDVSGWFEPIYFKGSKATTDTAGWDSSAFGLTMGLERRTGLGNLGLSFAWFGGTVHDESWQSIKTNSYELGAFWRVSKGPFYAFARVAADQVTAGSGRTFTGAVNGIALSYSASGRWHGWAVNGSGGASYKLELPGHFALKPMVVLDYTRLHENGYQEAGASAIALAVDARTSQSLTARTTVTASWSMGPSGEDGRPLTVELEGGRRNQLSGQLGETTAAYAGGNPFTLTPDALKGSWLGEARLVFGGFDYTWQLIGAGERTLGKTDLSLRAGLSMAF